MEGLKTFEPGFDYLAKTFAGMEDVLAKELTELGAKDVEIIKRGATFRGDKELLYKCNYLSRLAIRFLKPIGVFAANSSDQLYEKVRKIDWTQIFKLNQTFIVNANVFYSEVDHSHFASLRVKDAIVDQFREKQGRRPWVNTEKPDIYIDVHIAHDICTISLDSSGDSLHKREYKIAVDKAPINEVLAAGMIKISGWDATVDLIDPMCGSGTIPMEAAMMAMKIPAGYYRTKYAFFNWAGFDEDLWKKIKMEADEQITETECNIIASDRSKVAVNITKRNLKNAGLHKDIITYNEFFDELIPENQKGILIFNPPYGKRLEERGELRDIYKSIGNVLKQNYSGFTAWIITPNIEAAKFIGLRPSAKVDLYNGPIETKFLKFELYEGSKKGKYDSGNKREHNSNKREYSTEKSKSYGRKSYGSNYRDSSDKKPYSRDERFKKRSEDSYKPRGERFKRDNDFNRQSEEPFKPKFDRFKKKEEPQNPNKRIRRPRKPKE
jgi:putative N6-adenine-specific DNA methylase